MNASTPKNARFRALKWIGGLAVLFAILMLSISPDTPVSAPPNANQIMRLKTTASLLRDHAVQSAPQDVSLAWRDIQGAGALVARTIGVDRIALSGEETEAVVRVSVPLKFGLWLNARAYVKPSEDGFPSISARLGWVPVPAVLVRLGIRAVEQWLIWRGVDAPMPDGVVHQVSFDSRGAFARIRLPKDSRLYRTLNEARSSPVDAAHVVERYCRLASAQRAAPSTELITHVRRAFADAQSADDNKSALVALAMMVVTPDVGTLAGDVRQGIERCQLGEQGIMLLGRQDLAKHWTLSAALTAILGADISQAMGTWKEVADSGQGGTGFSFVDLAADRSGNQIGLLAADEATADVAIILLQTASEQKLLPLQSLALAEGLSEAEFANQFVDIDSPGYAAMVARIDRVLAGN